MNNLPPLSFDSSAVMMPSSKQPVISAGMKKQLLVLISQVRANFGGQDLTQETTTLWLDAWSEFAAEFGLELLRESLQRHCRTKRFLPLPADVRDGILAIRQERAQAAAAAAATNWTLNRYRQARDFDLFLTEQIASGKSREQVLRQFPGMAASWTAWHNHRAAGTLHCPQWCDTCEGDRFLLEQVDGRSVARPCPACRVKSRAEQAA